MPTTKRPTFDKPTNIQPKVAFRGLRLLLLCVVLLSSAFVLAQGSLEILVPVGAVNQPDYSNNVSNMTTDSLVTGATITIYWSDFDCGNATCTTDSSTSHNKYDWTITDAAFATWEAASGKKINIVLQMISNAAGTGTCASGSTSIGYRGVSGIGNCAMPPWVWNMLTSTNYSSCGGTQRIPNYFNSSFQSAYQHAVSALINHYHSLVSTYPQFSGNYVRPALGHGGEMLPDPLWNTTNCLSVLEPWSSTTTSTDFVTAWINNWLTPMANYMGGSNFNGHTTPMQIMGAITPMGTVSGHCTGCQVPDAIAPVYVTNNMGFGSQGFEISDVGSSSGTADWVSLFGSNTGVVPLELQTLGQSCPGGVANCDAGTLVCTVSGTTHTSQSLASCTGDLPTLLPFAEDNYATILEIYYQDWDLANVTGYCTKPGGTTQYCYGGYGTATHTALSDWVNGVN